MRLISKIRVFGKQNVNFDNVINFHNHESFT